MTILHTLFYRWLELATAIRPAKLEIDMREVYRFVMFDYPNNFFVSSLTLVLLTGWRWESPCLESHEWLSLA